MPVIQLYFQPMLTIGDQGDRPDAAASASPVITTQIVFMLFIEIAGGTAEAPFSILAAAAKAWAVREFPAIQTNSELLPALLSFDKLAGFLADAADSFEFQILPGSAMSNQAAKMAPFPMLPWLKLTPPPPAAAIDFATRKACSADFLASLTDPFAVPKPGAAAPAATRAPQTFPSLAAGMFTDYFVTVIRHLLDNPDAAAAAQAAGLFLMHGIRLPDPDAPTARDYPLYALSGQQLALPADVGSGVTVSLEASGGGVRPKVSFPKGDGTFTFSTIAAQVTKMLGVATPAAPFAPGDRLLALTQSEPFAVSKKRFALSAPVLWSQAGQAPRRIYALPFLLRDQVKAAPLPANGGLDLSLLQGMPDQVAATSYVWATRINFTIRQVADPTTPNRKLPTIYEIAGMDTDSRDDLLPFLTSAEASGGWFDVGVLYSVDAGSKSQGLQSDAIAAGRVWIVKSNLATEAHTAADAATSSADLPGARPDGSNTSAMAAYASKAETFLKLLWESSLVGTGGFHLFYGLGTGLPATLFGQTGTAVVSVMIVPQPGVAMKPYRNCVVWAGDGTPANVAVFVDPPAYTTANGDTFSGVAGKLNAPVETLLFANATTRIPGASGMRQYTAQNYDDLLSLALRYESQPLGATTLHDLWTSLLTPLQQVTLGAGTALQIHPGWVAARPTVPPGCVGFRAVANAPVGALQGLYSFLGVLVGSSVQPGSLPASPQGTEIGATGGKPFYRQILYLAGAADSNPYARIGQTATLALQYQDVFGNRCLDAAKAPTLTFQLGYRDSLIGVSQWPGTSVSFDFGDTSQIVFTFAFETKRYVPGPGLSFDTVLGRAANDLALYRLTAFQLGQPHMSVLVETSLAGAAVQSPDVLSACQDHVRSVSAFLESVLALTKVTSGVTHASLAGIADDHPGVKVDDLATVNQDVPNLLAIPGVPLAIPKLYTINRNEGLAGIVARQAIPLEALAAYNQDVPNLFAVGTQIQMASATYGTKDKDTLASIAGAMSVSVAQLATASQSAVLQAGTVIQTGQTLYDLRPADTLASIAGAQQFTVEALATANQDAQILKAGAAIKAGTIARDIQPGETLASIASSAGKTVSDLAAANQGEAILLPGAILQAGAKQYTIRGADTLGSVARDQRVTVTLLATANKDRAILNTADATVRIEIPVAPAVPDFAPAPVPFKVTPTIASTITPVSVSLVIARPNGSVDRLFADASQFAGIQSVESEIRPAAGIGENGAELRKFAARFEAAFSAFHLRLALGPDHAGTPEATTAKRFYAVRFQDVTPVFPLGSQPRYYAPAPLLNTGWSGSITSGGATVNFANVDLDAWAREFVTTLDLLLSPPYAAGLHASGQSATYHSLVSSKATIANAMGAAVLPVFQGTQPSAKDLTAAQDLLYQRVLVQLQEFYKVDAIVQFAVTTAYTGDAEAGNLGARLSGNLGGSLVTTSTPGAKPDFTLSDATIDLQQAESDLTFLLHLASSSQFADLQLALRFDLSAIDVESAFQGATLAPGYEAFDRLVLLPSSDASSDPFATVHIPVPLRAYPAPPSLITQEAVQSLPDRPTLADLKTFEYRFRFNYATAGQDQLQFHLTTLPASAAVNAGATASSAVNSVDGLPEALAAWSVPAASLNTALAALPDSAPDKAATDAATTFATLAGAIAAAWSTRSPQLAQPVAQLLAAGIEITQDNRASPDEQLVTVRSISPPDLLNVIAVQSVAGSLHVTRNRVLAGGNVNAAFVYQVPTVQFTNAVVPLFRSDDPIDITALPERPFITAQDALRRQVATLMANLLDATTRTPKDNLPNIRIAVAFEFALAEASGAGAVLPALVTRVPVALLPPFAFDPAVDFLGDSGMCARVAQELLRWHALQAPPAGTWVFDVSLFSNVGGDSNRPLPLLELTNLRAPAAE